LEVAYIVNVMEAIEYVDSKEGLATSILEALTQHNPDNVSARLQP